MKIKSVLCMPNLWSVSLHFAFFWCLGPSNSGCVNCSLKSSFSTNLCSPWYFIQHLYLFLGSCLVWYKAFHHDEKWKAFLLLLSVIEFKVIIYIWKSKSHYFNVIDLPWRNFLYLVKDPCFIVPAIIFHVLYKSRPEFLSLCWPG